ncbi:hypothetical protein ACEUZ9_004093 [Paracoccus litorisediminis]|uniref:hypothetical protein n=1 Tax=Paracoccus litorisediminis TaxID=2006130 RepID=UPI00372EABA5
MREMLLTLPPTERGPWNATSGGGAWSIQAPSAVDVQFGDIAIGLSRICRYNGQIREDLDFFSVAEHSVLMTEWAIDHGVVTHAEDAMAILLHDGSEAYFGDMTTEIKKVLPEYRRLEKQTQACVNEAFGLTGARVMLSAAAIKKIDRRMFMAEAPQVMHDPANNFLVRQVRQEFPDLQPLGVEIECLTPTLARRQFVDCFLHCSENMPARDPQWIAEITHHVEDAKAMLNRALQFSHIPSF